MASSSVRPSVGSPFNAFEDSAVFPLLSFLSDAARRYGPAKVEAARRKMKIIPARDAGRVRRKSALREETLFIAPSPLAGVRAAGTAGSWLSTHASSLTLWKKKSCGLKWSRALTVRCAETPVYARNKIRLQDTGAIFHSTLAAQLHPTCPASGKSERSRAERNASTLQTSWGSSWRRTK